MPKLVKKEKNGNQKAAPVTVSKETKQKVKKKLAKKGIVNVPNAIEPKYQKLTDHEMRSWNIPVNQIHPNPMNPNVQDDKTFNGLVRDIKKSGFDQPILVRPITNPEDARYKNPGPVTGKDGFPYGKDQQYELVKGEHRWEAVRVLNWSAVPTVIHPGLADDDAAKFTMVRDNMRKGKLDPEKFTKLYEQMLPKYGNELVQEHMGFLDAKEMEKYILDFEESIKDNPEMKKEFDKEKKNIKTIEDLSRIVNNLFTKYGSTLELNFMVFDFGGTTHCMIWMDKTTKGIVDEITSFCSDNNLDINMVMQSVLQKGWDEASSDEALARAATVTADDEHEDDEDVFDEHDDEDEG
jgi:ParB-like nuclease family protein